MEGLIFNASNFCLGYGLYCVGKEKRMRELFHEIEKTRVFDFEHIDSADSLPKKKPVFIKGTLSCNDEF